LISGPGREREGKGKAEAKKLNSKRFNVNFLRPGWVWERGADVKEGVSVRRGESWVVRDWRSEYSEGDRRLRKGDLEIGGVVADAPCGTHSVRATLTALP